MRVAVLTVLPHQEPLRESALSLREKRAATIPFDEVTTPQGIELDGSYAAVPVGDLDNQMGVASLHPNASQSFAVRGTIEVARQEDIPAAIDGAPVYADPHIAPFITCAGTPAVGTMADVRARLNTAALQARGLDGQGVAVAVMDTGVNLAYLRTKLGVMPLLDVANSWTPPGSATAPGTHPVAHGTMCSFDVLGVAPKATILDFSILATSAPGGAMVGSTLSVALQGFAQLISFWAVAFAPGGAGRYAGLVVSNSWGIFHPSWDFPPGHPGRYIDNPNHPFNQIVGVLARSGADILFAAGNCGADCPDLRCRNLTSGTITGANALPDVLTIAGCDTQDARVGYSAQGPSIAGMYARKPDVTCYTHFLGSEAFGTNAPDTGTSAACPVAAGCVAALRTRVAPARVSPSALFSQIQTTARTPPGGAAGWNANVGFGIIDPDAAGASLGV